MTGRNFFMVILAAAMLAGATSRAVAAEWSLKDLNGGTFKLSENLGQPLLLIYWATWCEPCKRELNQHRATFDSYVEKGVKVALISVDTQKSQAKVKPFIESKGYTWPVLLDPAQETLKSYGGNNVPFIVLLDKSGKTNYKLSSGLKDATELTSKIDALASATSAKQSK